MPCLSIFTSALASLAVGPILGAADGAAEVVQPNQEQGKGRLFGLQNAIGTAPLFVKGTP